MTNSRGQYQRWAVYGWWGFNAAISIAFAALAAANAQHVRHIIWDQGASPEAKTEGDNQKRAVVGACVLGAAMVLVHTLISLVVLLRNMVSKAVVADFWYGVLASSTLHVALFMILSALVQTIFRQSIEENSGRLGSDWTNVYRVTLGLSYCLVVTYLIQFIMLCLWQRAFAEQASSSATVPGGMQRAGAKKAGQNQKAIEFNRALQGNYNSMVV